MLKCHHMNCSQNVGMPCESAGRPRPTAEGSFLRLCFEGRSQGEQEVLHERGTAIPEGAVYANAV